MERANGRRKRPSRRWTTLDEGDINERAAPTIVKVVENASRGAKMMEEGKVPSCELTRWDVAGGQRTEDVGPVRTLEDLLWIGRVAKEATRAQRWP